MSKRKRVRFNAFHMNCVIHHSAGLWPHPQDKMHLYNDLNTWIELAQLLEQGKFDALFLADVVGVYDVFRGNRDAAVQAGAQVPVNDPALLIPTMAHHTKDLGFAFTSSVLQQHPFIFAKTLTTLDHLTRGRVAWNIVTSYLESTGKNLGLDGLPEHDERYAYAEEYLEVIYKLLEGSWQEGAVVKDHKSGSYADPSKVRDINHQGKYFKVPGCHLSEPSPQRTPVLYQAGASPRGRAFAAKHAECVFTLGPNPTVVSSYVKDTREQARKLGRNGDNILFFGFVKVITDHSEEAAWKKRREFEEYINYDGALALLSGWTGIDFSGLSPDQPIEYIETNAIRTMVQGFSEADPTRKWTMRDVARYVGIGGAGPVLTGSYEQIADILEQWVDVGGVDGFNLAYGITPGSYRDFIGGVVPILQKRGLMQTEYAEGTLREKLYGKGRARVTDDHPASRYRAL